MKSIIRDIGLAASGRQKINWAKEHAPLLRYLDARYAKEQPFAGLRLTVSIHLEAKTAYLATVLRNGGASVAVTGSNPLSTQDDVAAALVADGLTVYATHGCNAKEYTHYLELALDTQPQLIIDDGGDIVHLLHTKRREQAATIWGGSEETTAGVHRLKALDREKALLFPMIAVNDSYCKYLFDNRYGTGQSVWDGIMRTTNLIVAGKTVVVAGYGWCGKGVAMRAKGLGARVIVTEINPIRAIEAICDGFAVMPMDEAAPLGDFFITVTGCKDVITERHFRTMRNGAVLCNAGHFDVEVSKKDLEKLTVEPPFVARQNIMTYTMPSGAKLNLLGEGRLVNLACGDGHPVEIMDMSFALQCLAMEYLLKYKDDLTKRLYVLPEEIDWNLAQTKLKAEGKSIDSLTPEQEKYWRGECEG